MIRIASHKPSGCSSRLYLDTSQRLLQRNYASISPSTAEHSAASTSSSTLYSAASPSPMFNAQRRASAPAITVTRAALGRSTIRATRSAVAAPLRQQQPHIPSLCSRHPLTPTSPHARLLFSSRASTEHYVTQSRGFRTLGVQRQSRPLDEFGGILGREGTKGGSVSSATRATAEEGGLLSDQILRPHGLPSTHKKSLTLGEAMGNIKPLELSPEQMLLKDQQLGNAKIIDGKAIA
ncbi:hypothetical protein BGW38_008934, partial [Lunasporangiospora selenospora]